jgi:hypothetical protein
MNQNPEYDVFLDEPAPATNGEPEQAPPPFASDILARIKPYKLVFARDITIAANAKLCLIEGFLGRHELSIWFGEPESGKSTGMIDAACHVAADRPWCGRAVMPGPVLYVAAERGRNVKRRILAWRIEHGIDDFPLAVIDDAVDLRTRQVDTDRIIAAAAEVKERCGQPVVWIIFDTLSRVLAGGDENSPRDMGAVITSIDRIYRATNAHCSLIHHVPLGNSERMRGHGSALGAADTTVRVTKDDGIVTVEVAKASDLPEDEKPRLPFRFKSILLAEEPYTTASVLIPAGDQSAATYASKPATKRPAKGKTAIHDAIIEALDGHGQTITLRGGRTVRAAPVEAVRAEFMQRYTTGEPADIDEESRVRAWRRQFANLPPGFDSCRSNMSEWVFKV